MWNVPNVQHKHAYKLKYNCTSSPCACWPQTGRPWRSPSLPLQFHISEPPAESSPESRQIAPASASIYLGTKQGQSSALNMTKSFIYRCKISNTNMMHARVMTKQKSSPYCRIFSAHSKRKTPYDMRPICFVFTHCSWASLSNKLYYKHKNKSFFEWCTICISE